MGPVEGDRGAGGFVVELMRVPGWRLGDFCFCKFMYEFLCIGDVLREVKTVGY